MKINIDDATAHEIAEVLRAHGHGPAAALLDDYDSSNPYPTLTLVTT